MKLGMLIQARMRSYRLPGKMLLPLCGIPLLEHVIRRCRKVHPMDELVVITSDSPLDNDIVQLCERLNVSYFRGSEENVLERCIQATERYGLDAAVRLGADNPLVDWEIINEMLEIYLQEWNGGNRLDYLSNSLNKSFPLGLEAEVFRADLFSYLLQETSRLDNEERRFNEIHVVPYLHQNLERFNVYQFRKDFDHSHHRWTVDTPEDYEFMKNIYESLYPNNPDFLMRDVLNLLEEHPDWSKINNAVVQESGRWRDKSEANSNC